MPNDSLGARIKRSWNAFLHNDNIRPQTDGWGVTYRPDRYRLKYGNERSIVTALYNRIAIDVATVTIKHVYVDENGRFRGVKDSDFNNCLTLNANIDQTGRAFIQDLVLSLLDEGCVAVVPTDIEFKKNSATFDIQSLRVGKVVEWFPSKVKVNLYNEKKGKKEDVIVDKDFAAIIENPFYAVMNEPNSTLKRLIRKLALLDITDENNSSGKLDMIIQLPYVIKTEARRKQAEQRRADIEMQLAGSKYGIAYTDGTERITQLNKSVENQLLTQVERLTTMLYSQMGITEDILKGTADEQTLLNYNNQVIEPILSAITNEFTWKYLSKTARSRGEAIMFFRDPFKLVPVNNIADIADKFTRNEILSSNEVRGLIGFMPVDNPQADELRNKNINQSADAMQPAMTTDEQGNSQYDSEGNLIDENGNIIDPSQYGQEEYPEEYQE